MTSNDGKTRGKAVRHLGELDIELFLDRLIAMLNSEGRTTVETILHVLSEVKNEKLVEPLFKLLSGNIDKFFGLQVAILLGKQEEALVLERLLTLSKSDNDWQREWAIMALSHLGTFSTYEPLLRATTDENFNIRAIAGGGLSQIAFEKAEELVPLFIEWLEDPHLTLVFSAVSGLGDAKDARAVEPLLKLLEGTLTISNLDTELIDEILTSLGRIKDERAFMPLVELLDHPWLEVKRAAAWALGMFDDKRAIPYLTALLESDNDDFYYDMLKDAALTSIEFIQNHIGPAWFTR